METEIKIRCSSGALGLSLDSYVGTTNESMSPTSMSAELWAVAAATERLQDRDGFRLLSSVLPSSADHPDTNLWLFLLTSQAFVILPSLKKKN